MRQRSAYLILLVVGVVLGIGIAGIPTRHHDAPLRIVQTTTSVPPTVSAPTASATTASTTP